MTPIGESIGAVATATSWVVSKLRVGVEAHLGDHHPHRLAEAAAEQARP